MVHIKSTDHDLGNHTISYNRVYSWTFCEKLVGTHFTGDFWWDTQYQTLALADREILSHCRDKYYDFQSCFCFQSCFSLVMSDGFYVSKWNDSFPDGWVKKKSWQ